MTPLVRAVAIVLAVIAAAAAVAWLATAPARSDALCDAMKARFGPGYPCLNVPTNTFTPTAPTAPTTQGSTGQTGGGPQAGSNIGPGPGESNGTPIVPVPGGPQPTYTLPGNTPAAPAPAPTVTVPAVPGTQNGNPAPGAATTGTTRPPGQSVPPPPATSGPPSSAAPAPSLASNNTTATAASVGDDTTPTDDTQQMLWLVAAAAAIVAGASSTRLTRDRRPLSAVAAANGYPSITAALRSWLPGGGSERATIGSSQLVLINDPTSPRSYVFDEHVPPGGHIGVNPDGSATIYNRDGEPVGTIAKPWAYDSLGRPQRTWYTVGSDGRLVQHIDPTPNAVYPILADPDAHTLNTIKQQQQAANQGTPAHQKGTGTPLNKSPNADPPPPPANPPANTPDYGGHPHNQAATHSGLPAQETASGPDLVQQDDPAPSTTAPSDNPGLRDTLTAPITTPAQPESSPTQGPQPAPGQNLSYTDFLNNQLGNQTVGVVQQRPGPNNTTQYFRTDPNGHERIAIATGSGPGGKITYLFNDGSLYIPDLGDGVAAEVTPEIDGSTHIRFSDNTVVSVDRNGNGVIVNTFGETIGKIVNNQIERIPKYAVGVAFSGANYLAGKQLKAVNDAINATTAQVARSQSVVRGVPGGDPAAEAAERQVQRSLAQMGGLDSAAARLGLATKILSRGDVAALPLGVYFDIHDGVPPGQAISAGTGGVVGGIVAGAAATAGATALGIAAAPAAVVVAASIAGGLAGYYGTKWAYGKLPPGIRAGVDDAARSTGHAIAGAARTSWNAVKGLFR